MSEEKCPFCGAESRGIMGFFCGTMKESGKHYRSSDCKDRQLSRQAQEIERLRAVLETWHKLKLYIRILSENMTDYGFLEAVKELKDLGEI